MRPSQSLSAIQEALSLSCIAQRAMAEREQQAGRNTIAIC